MKAGDKVVCIDDKVYHPNDVLYFDNWIKEGEVYCIREIDLRGLPQVGIRVIGITGIMSKDGEISWKAERFTHLWTNSETVINKEELSTIQ